MTEAKPAIGTLIEGTQHTPDLLRAFADELERLRGCVTPTVRNARVLVRSLEGRTIDNKFRDMTEEDATEMVVTLMDQLDELAPPFSYFGSHPGDGADYGFWPCDSDYIADRVGEGDITQVSDLSEVEIEAPDYVLHVNDHGNATLYKVTYNPNFEEVWAVV